MDKTKGIAARALGTAALALACALGTDARAQTTTAVSNTGQTQAGTFRVVGSSAGNYQVAQKFTTGSNADGYIVSRVAVHISNVQSGDGELGLGTPVRPRIRIYTASGNNPGSLLYTLQSPVGSLEGEVGVEASATLAADTDYFVLVEDLLGNRHQGTAWRWDVSYTSSGSETGLSGWSIDGSRSKRVWDTARRRWESWSTDSGPLRIKLNGRAR